MTIDPTSDLFKAILSMDSYNRGYNAGIDLDQHDENGAVTQASDTPNVTHIGTATVIANSGLDFSGSDQADGFYAIAYQLPDDSVTISYRGTDQLTAHDGIGGDFANAYGIAGGQTDAVEGMDAFQFFQDVAAELNASNGF